MPKRARPWRDPISGYVSPTFAAGVMERVIRDFDSDADLGDGDWLLGRMLDEPEDHRVAVALALIRGKLED
jgi:hypothetical protein